MSLPRILRALERLQPDDHLCWVYDDAAGLQTALEACARAAARHGASLQTLAGPGDTEQSPEARLRLLAAVGRAAGWVAADLTAATAEPAAEFHTWLGGLWGQAAARPLQLVELYDRRRIGAALLFDLLRSHNVLVWEGAPYANEGATLPPAACERLRDPGARVGNLVAGLQRWDRVHGELERRVEELGAFQAIARAVNHSLSLEEILQAALAQVMTLVQADLGRISLWDQRSRRLLYIAVQGGPAELADRLRARQAVHPLDEEIASRGSVSLVADARGSPPEPTADELRAAGYSSFLLMPLGPRGTTQGAITLAAREPGHFGPPEAALLEALSEQIGIALDNARLYHEARRRAEEMGALYELSQAATSLDPQDILALIAQQITRQFAAECFFVALLDAEQDQLHFAYLMDQGEVLKPFTAPLQKEGGLTGYVLQTGRPLLVADLQTPPDGLPAAPIHFGQAARSWLGVPMVAKGRSIGVISVQAYTPAAFDEDDQRLLSLAAQQAAAALENARLFQETHRLEQRYHALLENLNDGYAVLQDGHLVFANARLGRMLGSSPEELLMRPLEELQVAEERQGGASSFLQSAGGPGTVHHRRRLLRSDGSELPVELTLNHIDYEGRPALAVLCRDISQQVRLEAQLLLAERLSALGQLVSGVAHELNNPLTTIKGYTQLLQGEGLPPTALEDLKRVEEAADRCRRIVGDLLTFARSYAPERSDTDLNELLQRTVALRSYELRVRSIAVRWDLDPRLPIIQADPHRLQQVILNLVFNAEQALSATESGEISIHSRLPAGGSCVRFEIADNGPGIRPEHLDRIFDPFFTTKRVGEGTGLGLSISYGIVQEHGGSIWAESHYGAGAAFIVELPLVAGQATAPRGAAPGRPGTEG